MPLTALAAALFGATAQAPEVQPFDMDEAARCAAVFAFTLDAMQQASNVPQHIERKTRDGLAIWEYELSRSAPDAEKATLQSAANRAVAYVRADMPGGQGSDAAAARGDFLTASSAACFEKIATNYDGQVHPVIPFLRKAEVAVEAPSRKPVATPVSASAEEKPKARGLR